MEYYDRKFLYILTRQMWQDFTPTERRRATVLAGLLAALALIILSDLLLVTYTILEHA